MKLPGNEITNDRSDFNEKYKFFNIMISIFTAVARNRKLFISFCRHDVLIS